MKRDEAIQLLRAGRKELQDTLTELTEEDYARAKVVGKWSLQDLLACTAAWDEEMVRILQTFPMPGESLYSYTLSDRNEFGAWNQEQVELRRAQTLAQTMAELEKARRDLIQVVEGLTDAVLGRTRLTPWGKAVSGFELLAMQAERDRESAAAIRSFRRKKERWARARKNLTVKRKTKSKPRAKK